MKASKAQGDHTGRPHRDITGRPQGDHRENTGRPQGDHTGRSQTTGDNGREVCASLLPLIPARTPIGQAYFLNIDVAVSMYTCIDVGLYKCIEAEM